jgi:hypothetical protein
LNDGKIENRTKGVLIATQSVPPFIKGIVDEGGIKNFLRKHPNFEGI